MVLDDVRGTLRLERTRAERKHQGFSILTKYIPNLEELQLLVRADDAGCTLRVARECIVHICEQCRAEPRRVFLERVRELYLSFLSEALGGDFGIPAFYKEVLDALDAA